MELTTGIVRRSQTCNQPPIWRESQKKSEMQQTYYFYVKMAHGHDTITGHPMHEESQACVHTVLLLPLLPPRPKLLLLQCAGINTKLPLTAVPAYPLAKTNGRY